MSDQNRLQFRQWSEKEKKFVYWGCKIDSYGNEMFAPEWNGPARGNGFTPETSEQFTGLTDKNGAKIWEGDIVKYIDCEVSSSESGTDYDDFENRGVIYWESDDMGWSVTNPESIDRESFWEGPEFIEVIGNIHEHPELINPPAEEKP